MNNNLMPFFVFLAFLCSLIIVAIIRKIYYYVRYKKRFYIIPRVSIKGISSIAIVIAISISIIILITIGSADLLNVVFRSWPGTRITIEGILIKIGGLLFGPFIGLFIGLITDLLTVVMTAGVFHYGYLISAMAFGLMSGLISDIFKSTRKKGWSRALLGTFILFLTILIMISFFYFNISSTNLDVYQISFMGMMLNIKISILIGVLTGFIFTTIGIIWLTYLIVIIKRKKTVNKIKEKKMNEFYLTFITVLVASVICNVMINVIMMPTFDAQLSSIKYNEWLIIRSLLFIPEVVFNCAIILPIYKIAIVKLDYNYRENLIESITYPVYID
ncbi:MAG: hypothetical protein K2I36_02160 [Ureaplasma sp.]|nr:hypothetical protein [Ureaplasma sp.]